MTPFAIFSDCWNRCGVLSTIHAYLASNTTAALRPEEILRAEWAARVSALDLYVHELVAQRMLAIFQGAVPAPPQYRSFRISVDILDRIRSAPTAADADAAFDFEVRRQLGFATFQDPEKIAEGVRLISGIELWNEIALNQGANPTTKNAVAKGLRLTLSAIVERRNKIVHEGDLRPSIPREPWPISQADLRDVESYIEALVRSIEAVV